MKKIITLLFAAFAVTASFAQTTSQEESRRVILGKQKKSGTEETTRNEDRSARDIILGKDGERTSRKDDGTYSSTERQARIDRINRDYDNKIQSIRNNPNLSAEEKERIIRGLENERAKKIREVNNDYKRDRDDDDDDRDGKKEKVKGNNGKHLGWEKGVGNPHRTGSDKQTGKGKSKDRDDDDDDRKNEKSKSKSKSKGKKG